jgi:raffinose/stachyose/melibiose transport system substrate-binding protein
MTFTRPKGAARVAGTFIAVTALVVAGCGSSSSSPTSAPATSAPGSTEAAPTEAASTEAAACTTPTEITWLGTIKIEIQDQFKAAIEDYNTTNKDCVHVTVVDSPQGEAFLQTVTPMYEAGKAPTIMTALQELPDMADKVMDWTGQPLADLAAEGTLDVANINGKQVGLPITAEAFGLLYNKAVLDAAGVDVASIATRSDLAAALDKIAASGPAAAHFSGLWWSLGAHFTNIYHANSADTAEGRMAILDQLKAGTYDLMSDPAYVDWLDTFDLLKKNSIKTATISDDDYNVGVENLSSGATGYWFMGNWAEPNLLEATPDGKFGVSPVAIHDTAGAYGNDSISVGVPFYMMIDQTQSTQEQRDAATSVISWLLTTPEGQAHWAGPIESDGMNFIPVYKGFNVTPSTYMAAEIAKYIADGKTLQWVNSAYPAGLQECYGAAAQKYYDGKTDRPTFAKEMEACWVK